ncbi:hypothetical protein FRZ61_43000 [Hypericibacter adhaerens]|jgi:hypothetical protein|uniref:Uncharacterized protein n=1 Tax=Hypericibacter adhaerens TaxID=2602016 RepID=A0A5J6N3J5_9PROT|nr:hypothetical protein [Hypericibacter adhaerens]QEX24359.1 hypothetical protein FRZ61_43000 [Hypericibacter adhaerens]
MRTDPRITATKLAEYMSASFARKRSIIQEQKYPQEVAMVRWRKAERPVALFVAQGQSDLKIIDEHIARLAAENPDTEFKIQNRDLCIAALKSFKLLSNQLSFEKFKKSLGAMQQSMPIPINGVDVSVLPQVVLQGTTQKGTKVVGGIKFSFPKTHPLNAASAEYLSVLIHWHCECHLSKMGKPDLRLCHAVDVPTATMFEPPKSYKRRRQHIEEACHEIVQRWPNVPPP